jgi:hypothetical protein
MTKNSELIITPEIGQPLPYIERTRNYYLGLDMKHPMSGRTLLTYHLPRQVSP